MSPARLGSASYRVLEVKPLDSLSVEDKIREVQERLKGLDAPRDPVRLSSYTLIYNEVVEYKIVVTSDGGLVESVIPRVSVTCYNW